jgi:hypothetical protein
MMTKFMQKYNNTNIIVPHRFDLAKNSRVNLQMQAYNAKLRKIPKSSRHVAVVELESNGKYFTKHGLHLNHSGKECLAKIIATKVDKLINNKNIIKTVFAIKWKDDKINENDFSKVLLSSTQSYNSQDDISVSEASGWISRRQNRVTITRCEDFLWQK